MSTTELRFEAHPHARHVDVESLERTLRQRVRGEVRFDAGSRGAYATDSSNFRQVPICVVLPRDTDDLIAAVGACREHGAPITHRGGGTSLAGQTTNVAVVIDSSKYLNRLLELNAEERWAWVEPGIVLDDLRGAAEEHHLTFGPDPSTHDRCTLGGMIGNNSCGVHSVMAGRVEDNVLELDVLLYDGTRLTVGPRSEAELDEACRGSGRAAEIHRALRALRDEYADRIRERYPDIPRRVSGYNLNELLPENGCNLARALVGSEGTCVTVLRAKLRLVHSPPGRTLVVCGYPDIADAADDIPAVMEHHPIGCEGVDHRLVENMTIKHLRLDDLRMLPDGRGYLLVEFGGEDKDDADANAKAFMDAMSKRDDAPHMVLYDDRTKEQKMWEVRESGLGATARVPGHRDTWPGWEDSAVDPAQVGAYLRELRQLYEEFGYDAALYGHFGQGCIHTRIPFELKSAPGVEQYREFLEQAADLVLKHGGSVSGEHGDGQQRSQLLAKMYGPDLVEAFRRFKAIWDPDDRMNPGKLVDPVRHFGPTENLRLGTAYRPIPVTTHFAYRDDSGSFAEATLRCVGVGKCRRKDGDGVMCPSYLVTHEEEHSTRGRARLLFEMLDGEVITDGWRSEAVRDALDLCLSCKGCKSDCPVSVDMATYKAEFLAHHYARRLRPRPAYAMGLIMFHARLASKVPRLANGVLAAPGLGTLLKKAAGISPRRPAPKFAHQTFRDWYAERPPRSGGNGRRVVLFPDTFTNHFHPEVGQASAEVLEAAGFDVVVPSAPLCCGRPLFDYGMLPTAKRLYRRTLRVLRDEIRAGTPIVVPEPSCAASFRDELPNLLPEDEDAHRMAKHTVTFSELMARDAADLELRRTAPEVVYWRHCHQHAVLGTDADTALLERLGAEVTRPQTSCCGLAGSWGFEAGKFDLSMQSGELSLFPVVREHPDAVVVADGFSCRTQLEHGVGRQAVHLAQLVREALPR